MSRYKAQEKLTKDVFVEPFPLGYGVYVWAVLKDGVTFRIFSSEDDAEKEIAYLESLEKLLHPDPEPDDSVSIRKGPGLQKPK